jgi:competence protein ComFC
MLLFFDFIFFLIYCNFKLMFIKLIKNILFIKQCPSCSSAQEDDNICFDCFSNLSFIQNACKMCQHPLKYIVPGLDVCLKCEGEKFIHDEMICVFKYNSFLKNLIIRLKNQSDFAMLSFFGKVLGQKIPADSILIPIPLFKNRLIWRGFNQSFFLAKEIKKNQKIEVIDALKRVKNTKTQHLKKLIERFENIKGAFELNKKYEKAIKNKNIIIIDDVITTGATVFEAARTLKKAGCAKVTIISIARRIKEF